MPVGWFLAQYKPVTGKPTARYCSIDDHRDIIAADGGSYIFREVLGGQAVVKVGGVTLATLVAINNDPVIRRFPGVNNLTDSLSVLTTTQWANYRSFAISLGYAAAEWDAAFPLTADNYLLRDVVLFLVGRRLEPRWDASSQTVILDGATVQPAASADEIDAAPST